MKESVARGHCKMRYSFSSCSSVPCISLLLRNNTRIGKRLCVCAHAWDNSRPASIRDPAFITGCYRSTPASKQDRPLFEGGLYSRKYGTYHCQGLTSYKCSCEKASQIVAERNSNVCHATLARLY